MPSPPPILPLGPGIAASRPRAQAAPVLQQMQPTAALLDEGIVDGLRRRFDEFVTDLRKPQEATAWATIAVLSGLLIYSYWPGLVHARTFWDNPQYQHGWIVPVINLALLFWRRQPVSEVTLSARLAGIGLLTASFVVRLVAANFMIITIDMYTFVPALAGVFLMAGGWGMFRWAAAPIAMTIFMYPLPDEAQRYITGPLQLLNTTVATFILQSLGFDAAQEGNLIRLGQEHVMNVVDACAGLKMLTIFVWLCALVTVVAGLHWWENIVIAASAVPIAIMANTLRITTAGMLYGVSPTVAEGFHDSVPAALLMMAIAVGFILLEMKILSCLFIQEELTPKSLVPRPSAATNPRFPGVLRAQNQPNGPEGGSRGSAR